MKLIATMSRKKVDFSGVQNLIVMFVIGAVCLLVAVLQIFSEPDSEPHQATILSYLGASEEYAAAKVCHLLLFFNEVS